MAQLAPILLFRLCCRPHTHSFSCRVTRFWDIDRRKSFEGENGDTAVVYAVSSRTSTRGIIVLLAKLGANVNHMTFFQGLHTSLLGFASALEHWELANELLDREADANDDTRKWQILPLEIACGVGVPDHRTQARQSRRALVAKLLQRGETAFGATVVRKTNDDSVSIMEEEPVTPHETATPSHGSNALGQVHVGLVAVHIIVIIFIIYA